jgi:hypothetical protein
VLFRWIAAHFEYINLLPTWQPQEIRLRLMPSAFARLYRSVIYLETQRTPASRCSKKLLEALSPLTLMTEKAIALMFWALYFGSGNPTIPSNFNCRITTFLSPPSRGNTSIQSGPEIAPSLHRNRCRLGAIMNSTNL